ncbi:MAG: bifunctional heptose 7-phosphate kinase/heptose 1-phosphate adenyltransferase, partial [Bryobacteraceae bacterium]|nr:bifunctional heptose 7-phosphate kinase/heptose 1-phosphate adenyltransferase [Bryobacteraceae bacterium]
SGLAALLVTRGSAGMTLIQEDSVRHFPSFAREVYDVSGAGDTVAAVLGAAMGAGLPLEEAVTLANVSAGLVVAKVGTAVVTPEEIIQEIRHHSRPSADRKLLSAAEAADEASKWRRLGLRIGFTSGCFDLLHPGHIALLKQARESCDRLIVGLNSNRSAAVIKGPNRPVQDEAARATVLASLAFVDAVVIFDELTPENLIRALRPDVFVQGADYRPGEGAAADLVRGWGGEVVLADIVPGHSTTGTIHRFVSGSEQ